MTDDTTPETPPHDVPDADVLAVHAVLDDEAGPEERRRVAADPDLLALLAQARAARDAVAAAPRPPADDVLAAVRARALDEALEGETAAPSAAAAEVPADPEPDPAATSSVEEIDRARERRGSRVPRRLPPLPAVAAVVIVLVLIGVGLLATADDGDEETATDVAVEAADGEETAGSAASESREVAPDGAGAREGDDRDAGDTGDDATDEAPAAAPSPDVAAVIDDLLALATSAYPSPDDLFAELRIADPTSLELPVDGSSTGRPLEGAGVGPDDVQVARCDVINSNQEGLEPATAAVVVDIEGTPILVTSNPDPTTDAPTDAIRLTVMELPSCIPLGGVVR